MQLSDTDIIEELDTGELIIEPITNKDVQIQPASVDVRLGNTFLKQTRANTTSIDPLHDNPEEYMTEHTVEENDTYTIHPGDFVLGETRERFKIPDYLTGNVEGRSTIGRMGVLIHVTAGLLDPGWEGHITLEIANVGKVPMELSPDMRIGQVTFTENKSPCDRPYGEERGSKYQGQTGVQAARTDDIENNQ